MPISRRHLLRRIGTGAAAAALGAATSEARPKSEVRSLKSDVIRLNKNENAYGPSAKVIAAMTEAAQSAANRYADVETEALRHKIARFHAVTPEQVVLGCGSGEILRMAAEAFAGPGKKVIVAEPTFELMGACARRVGAEVVAVALTKTHSHDLNAMRARSDAATGLVYICNPNNPTGTLTRRQDLEAFLRALLPTTAYVLVDEAYHDYVDGTPDYASFIDRPVADSRLIVVRSFSTMHGLAGLRVGYAIAAPQTARLLTACQLPENLNIVAATAAAAAIDDAAHVRLSASRNADDRQEFVNQAHGRMLKEIDSHTNFVMLNTERAAGEIVAIVEHFRKHDVLVSGPFPGFDKHIGVSLGTPAEMREFWRVWDILRHGMSM
jgi:histidinol-phosphate aminotransferase